MPTVETDQDSNGAIDIQFGGTNGTTAAEARNNLGLGSVDNTSDTDKPISDATQIALAGKLATVSTDTSISGSGTPGDPLVSSDFVVNNMFALINIPLAKRTTASILGFFFTAPESDPKGHGKLVWEAGLNKNLADGGLVVDPDSVGTWDGTPATLKAQYYGPSGQGTGSGNGCWVKVDAEIVSAADFGLDSSAVDNGTAINATLATRKEVRLPITTTAYDLTSDIVVEDNVFRGGNTQDCRLDYSGTGRAIAIKSLEYSAGLHNMFLNYTGAGAATGVYLGNNTNHEVTNLKIDNFTGIGLRLGDAGSAEASFFADVRNLYIRLDTGTTGDTGVFIDGGVVPSSNSNTLKNVFTNGKFTNAHIHIKGNSNHIKGGDCQWEDSAASTAIIYIEGSGNTIEDVYMEPAVDFLTPDTIIKFGPNAFGNRVRVWMVGSPNFSWENAIDDQGSGNIVEVMPRGSNFPANFSKSTKQNLVRNANFDKWKNINNPVGFHAATVRCTRDDVTTFRDATSIKMTEAASHSSISCYLTDSFASSLINLPADALTDKNIAVGVWCNTTEAGAGSIGIRSNGTGTADQLNATSKSVHSGSGNWEFLSTTLRIPSDMTTLFFDLRSRFDNADITGDVYFSSPVLMYGDTAFAFAEHGLDSNGDTATGDLSFYNVPASTDPADFAMIELNGSFLWVDAAGDLRISTTRPTTDTDSEGTVVGTQT